MQGSCKEMVKKAMVTTTGILGKDALLFSWAGRYIGQSLSLNSKMFRLAGIWKLPQHGQASYGSLEAHMEELPHPSRNVTVSRIVIMVAVAVLVGLLTISTWYFTHSYPKSAVASLSESLRLEILVNTSELLDEIFSMNTYGSMAIANLMEKNFLGDDFSTDSFIRIRDAAWSVFKALPVVTTLGVTALNGLTAVYGRGYIHEVEGMRGNFFLYTNETTAYPVYYKEFVSEINGDPLGPPSIERLALALHETSWFQEAMSIPVNNLTWTIGRSLISGQAFVLCGISKQAKSSKEVALIHSTLSAMAINDFIGSLELKGGSVFIADKHGTILFSSEPTVCMISNKSECETTPLDSGSILNDGKAFLQSQVSANVWSNEIHVPDVLLRGKRWSIDAWPYKFETVKLSVVVMIPRHSFWGPMDYYTRITWISLPLLSLGVVFIGCSLIYLLVEQVQAEEKLRAEIIRQSEAKCRAEASRDAKTTFLSSMSHELRTPMACIIGLLDMLLMEHLSVEHEGSVRQIHRCATSLVSLLNSALDIAKVESGKLVLEKAEFNLEAELTALIDVFAVQCDNKNLFIALELADDVPKNVVGDSARVMQVFTNLIGNSIKFTSKGRIIVRGRLGDLEPNGLEKLRRRSFSSYSLGTFTDALPAADEIVIVFEVDDTGPGIEPALREKVFENFVQGDASTTRTHGGTGLGLGIVRSLVQLMGGNIKIVEKNGPGSNFQFSICFQCAMKNDKVPFDLPLSYQGAEVVIGLPDIDCRAVAADWVTSRGLKVYQVETWEQILLHLRALNCGSGINPNTGSEVGRYTRRNGTRMNSSEGFRHLDTVSEYIARSTLPRNNERSRYDFWKRRKSFDESPLSGEERQLLIIDTSLLPKNVKAEHLEEYLQESGFLTGSPTRCLDGLGLGKLDFNEQKLLDMQRNLLVVWVTSSNTQEPIKVALRSVQNSFIVRRPLHAARLKEIFQQIARDGSADHCSPEPEYTSEVFSANAINYAKQQEWDDPYGCDLEVQLAHESSSRVTPSVTVSGRNMRQRPTAAKSAPLEEILYSEMENRSSQDEQTSQTPSTITKPVKKHVKNFISPRKAVKIVPKPLEKLEILVAEDTPLLLKLAVAMLRRLGAVTHEASNGQEVLDTVTKRLQAGQPPFHCILMDCQMPVMDGYEACQALREAEKDISRRTAVVALTANAMASDEQKCLQAGMDAFLTKPIDQDYMVQIILQTITSNDVPSVPTSSSLSTSVMETSPKLHVEP